MNYPALRCVDAYNFLGGDIDLSNDPYYTNTVFRHNWIDIMEADSGPDGMNFINRISKKDGERELVLLNAGGADIFYCTAKMSFSNSGFSPSNTDELESFIQNLISNYNKFLKYFPALIERIKELNDTATIAIIGTFNPLKDLKLTADSLLPVGNLAAVITNDMNRHYRQWAKQYGCMYVDISNVDTLTLESDITLDMFSSIDPLIVYHASPDGYKYIARQILRQLEEGSSIRRDISIDLGSAGDVTKVSFSGLPILKFSFDPETRELILPYSLRLPGLIKVTETRGGNSYDIIYGMSWLSGAYAANRIFASKNARFSMFLEIQFQNFKYIELMIRQICHLKYKT